MNEEISKNTILVLVVLTVVISLLGTWTVLNEVNKIKISSSMINERQTAGQVKLTISPPEEIQTSGQVALIKIQ